MFAVNYFGYIPQSKSKEFKQCIQQLMSHQGEDFNKISIFQDQMNEDTYHVQVLLNDKESMILFQKSENSTVITGAFKVLGLLKKSYITEFADKDEQT